MTNSVENNRGKTGIIGLFASMPLSAKLFLLVFIALIPRIIVFLQPQIITNDGILYIKMAKLFSEGKYAGAPGSYFNLYPLMIFFVQRVNGDWELSGRLISIILGTLTVIPVFLLGRSLYNERAGWLSAIFYITLPNFLRFDANVLRDPTLWFFMVFTFWFVWEGIQKNGFVFFGLASIGGGLGALTRVEGFILWGVLALYVAFGRSGGISIKRRTLHLSLLILLFPILVSFILFPLKKDSSRKAFGEMASFSLNFIKAHTASILKPLDPIDAMDPKIYESLPTISHDSLELASRHRFVLAIFEVIYKFIKSANLLILLMLLGIWKRKKEGFGSSDRHLLYIFAALFIMSVLYARQLYYFSTRHGLTLVLPCLFFAGQGLDAAVGILSRGTKRLGSGWGLIRRHLLPILTFLLILIFLFQGLGGEEKEKTTIKEAGLWLKQNGYQGSVVMGPKKFFRLAFYADGSFVQMPDSWEGITVGVRRSGVKIIVIDSSTIQQDCPDFPLNWPKAGLVPLERLKGTTEIYSVP